jgi:tetratricopeptide (TPR) repeat protein
MVKRGTALGRSPDSQLPDFDAAWDFSNPASTEAVFRSMLSEHPDAPKAYRLALVTQIARTLGLQRKFDSAQALLDGVEKDLDDAPIAQIRYLLERGRLFNSCNRPEQARPLFERAFALAVTTHEDRLAVDAAHMVAITFADKEALDWNVRALEIAEASEDPATQRWQGSLYNNIGWVYHDRGDYERALAYFEKSVEFRLRHGQREPLRVARWTLARGLRSLGRYEQALEAQRALQRDFPEVDSPYVEEEIGECLLALGKPEEARLHFTKAYERLKNDPDLNVREPARLARLEKLASSAAAP